MRRARTAPSSGRRRAYGAAFDPETGALPRATPTRSPPASRSTRPARRSSSSPSCPRSPRTASRYAHVGQLLRRLPVRHGPIVGVAGPRRSASSALGIEDPAEAKQALIDAFQNNDAAALKPIAEFWNTGFDADQPAGRPGPVPERRRRTTSPATTSVSQMTFEANPDYTWGPQPQVPDHRLPIIGDPTAAVQAMENEEVDIIQPQSTADLLTQLEGLADRGIEVDHRTTGDLRARRPGRQQRRPVRPGDLRRRRGDGARRPPGVPQDDPSPGHRRPPDRPAEPGGRRPRTRSRRSSGCAGLRRHRRGQRLGTSYADVDIEGAMALLEERRRRRRRSRSGSSSPPTTRVVPTSTS